MTMKTTLGVAVAGFLATTSLVLAETARPYVTLGAGLSYLEDSDISGGGSRANIGYDNPGFALLGAVGMGVFDNFRIEAELAHRENNADNFNGDVSANSLMGNVFYDIPVSLGPIKPFVGLGLGAARVKADTLALGGALGTVNDTDNAWAYQAIIGLAAPIAENLSLLLDYRYFSTFDDLSYRTSTGVNGKGEYENHAVMVGLRWSFGAAPAAPAPMAQPVAAPQPAPTPRPAPVAAAPLVRSFQVFFDFDKSDITDDARKIIVQAADNAKKAGGTTRITLTGHADRSGPAQYNLRLSQRRADAVKAELVKLGVGTNDIATIAKGESDPLVATADGVREPRNRRVEIVF